MAYTWSNYSDLTRVPGPPNQEVDEEGELGRPFFLNILSTLGRQNTLESSGWLVCLILASLSQLKRPIQVLPMPTREFF